MREHPIPQDIVGYRFHIIGSMTLKQFGELAAGVILGLIIYATNLPNLLKWPLIFIVVIIGAAAAFLPIAGQPLDHWLGAFFRTLYKPTKYFWEKSKNIPSVFTFEPGSELEEDNELDLTPMHRQRIKDYLATVGSRSRGDALDLAEQEKLSQIINAFNEVEPKEVEAIKLNKKPNLKVSPRSLTKKKQAEKKAEPIQEKEATVSKKQQIPVEARGLANEIEIPAIEQTKNENKGKEKDNQNSKNNHVNRKPRATYVESSKVASSDQLENTEDQSALFNKALPFPSQPTEPNKIVGMLLNSNRELIPDAIIEVVDEDGHVLRAVKSNALGQFFITTPLSDGRYTLRIEHDQYQFQNQKLELNHEIVEPIEIRSLT